MTEVPEWKLAAIEDATPYCLSCEKEGHKTSDCHSTSGFNSPRQMEIARLAWGVGATPAPAQTEAHEEDSLEWKLSCVIDYATGGKLSKPGWALATIRAAIDEHVNALYEEWSEDRDDDEESEEPDPLHVANERGEGEPVAWKDMDPWMRAFLAEGESYVRTLYNEPHDAISRTDAGSWIQIASEMLRRLPAAPKEKP